MKTKKAKMGRPPKERDPAVGRRLQELLDRLGVTVSALVRPVEEVDERGRPKRAEPIFCLRLALERWVRLTLGEAAL